MNKNRILTIVLIAVIGFTMISLTTKPNSMNTIEKSKNIVFTVEFDIKPEYRKEFLISLTELIEEMSKEETFVYTYLHEDKEDPNKFMIYERWNEPSFDAFAENQLKGKRYRDDYESKISEWSKTSRVISVLHPLNQWENLNLKPEDNNLAFYVNFHIKPEMVEEWRKGALHVLNSMSVENTFVAAFLHQDTEDPTHFTLYERWNESSMESFVKNQLEAKEYRSIYEKQLPGWSKASRTFSQLIPLGSWIRE